MRAYLFDSERLVYEGEGWGIIIDDNPRRARAYATHQACTIDYDTHSDKKDSPDDVVYGSISWESTDIRTVCAHCGITVPEGIQGLIIMTSKGIAWNG